MSFNIIQGDQKYVGNINKPEVSLVSQNNNYLSISNISKINTNTKNQIIPTLSLIAVGYLDPDNSFILNDNDNSSNNCCGTVQIQVLNATNFPGVDSPSLQFNFTKPFSLVPKVFINKHHSPGDLVSIDITAVNINNFSIYLSASGSDLDIFTFNYLVIE